MTLLLGETVSNLLAFTIMGVGCFSGAWLACWSYDCYCRWKIARTIEANSKKQDRALD